MTAPNLASVLDQHSQAIVIAWIDAVDRQLSASGLCSIPRERRHPTALVVLRSLIDKLSGGHDPDLAAAALAAATEMVQLGAGIDEILEAILLGKDAVLPFIWQAYPPGSQAACSAISQFDAVMRHAARVFIAAYAQASQHLESHQRQKAQVVAVLLERVRLAQEIHDDLAQAVGYLHAQASLTHDLLSTGEIDRAEASLLDMTRVAGQAYDEVTEAIFSLRTKVPGGDKFLPALREYLVQYGAYYGLVARLVIDDKALARFSSAVASQVLFIIREALTNVRKHSGAGGATVRFARDNGLVRITIEDSGHGFDLSRLSERDRPHFGLQIMRERAESVGGSLAITSQAGDGTCVTIWMPPKPAKSGDVADPCPGGGGSQSGDPGCKGGTARWPQR